MLDNFEQVLDAAPDVAALLAASPAAQGRRDEPRAAARGGRAGAADLAAGRRARGRAVPQPRARRSNPRREPGGRARADRAHLRAARRAAARDRARGRAHKLLAPAAILERLEHRLDLLSGGPRDAPARQQTLRAAIGWSYDLLAPEDQRLFAAARRVRRRLDARGWPRRCAGRTCSTAWRRSSTTAS